MTETTEDTVAHAHDEPVEESGAFVPDPGVQAYVTTVTLALAHTGDTDPRAVIQDVTQALEGLGLRGVVTGVAAVELRGDGGLIGL
jgi:hypothetical protein